MTTQEVRDIYVRLNALHPQQRDEAWVSPADVRWASIRWQELGLITRKEAHGLREWAASREAPYGAQLCREKPLGHRRRPMKPRQWWADSAQEAREKLGQGHYVWTEEEGVTWIWNDGRPTARTSWQNRLT